MSKRKKVWLLCGTILLLIVVVAVSINASSKNTVLVQTSKAQRKDILTSKVSATGQIRAKEFVDLQPEVAGVITELLVHEGDRVKKGEVLLRIDPIQTAADNNGRLAQYDVAMADVRSQEFLIKNAEANLLRDEASLRSSHADLEQAENNFTRMQRSFDRQQQLMEEGLITRDSYESAQNDLQSAKSRLEVAKAQTAQIETQVRVSRNNIEQNKTAAEASLARTKSAAADLMRTSDQLKKTTIVSPLDGVITQLDVTKGEHAQPGIMSNPQATVMTIADLSTIQAELKVDETDIVGLTIGNSTKVKIDALPNEVFDGEVTEIGNSPIQAASSSQQEAKDFKVIVTLKDPSSKLRPGMSCTADIITSTKRNTLVIPIQALTVRDVDVDKDGKYLPPAAKSQNSAPQAKTTSSNTQKKELEGVFVIDSTLAARFRVIKTGITGESEIEVLDNIKEGEEIVSGSFQTLRTLKDGAAIKIDRSAKTSSEKKS